MENLINEIWIDIKDYEGLYQVSNLGNIKALEKTIIQNKGKTYYARKIRGVEKMKFKLQNAGYNLVWLSKNGKSKAFLVHRLVGIAFLSGDFNKDINHKNGIKIDNRVENLEWVTKSENIKHAHKIPTRKSISTKILCVELNQKFSSIIEASKELNISPSSISHVINNRNKTAGNYTWKRI